MSAGFACPHAPGIFKCAAAEVLRTEKRLMSTGQITRCVPGAEAARSGGEAARMGCVESLGAQVACVPWTAGGRGGDGVRRSTRGRDAMPRAQRAAPAGAATARDARRPAFLFSDASACRPACLCGAWHAVPREPRHARRRAWRARARRGAAPLPARDARVASRVASRRA
jgi:hypothetical protein